jgi:hypothetical protein
LAKEHAYDRARAIADRARAIDDMNAPEIKDVNDAVALSERQIARGETSEAKTSLMRAYESVRARIESLDQRPHPPYELMNAQSGLSEIIDKEIEIGAFAEAIEAADLYDRNNRLQYLVRIVDEEAKRHDTTALRETLPIAIEKIHDADYRPSQGQYAAELAKVLGRAGYNGEARTPLKIAQALAQEGVGGYWPRSVFGWIAQAQVALGDLAGAYATLDTVGNGQSEYANLVPELVVRHDFKTALEIATAARAPARDIALSFIATGQAEDDDMISAYSTARLINNQLARYQALMRLLSHSAPRTRSAN